MRNKGRNCFHFESAGGVELFSFKLSTVYFSPKTADMEATSRISLVSNSAEACSKLTETLETPAIVANFSSTPLRQP